MLSTWFATPVLLWTLYAVPVCVCFLTYARFRRQRAMARLANAVPLRKQTLMHSSMRSWKTLATLLGIGLIALACAGPQWGLDRSAMQRKGRDVIIVLDLSRSMLAEQPSRRELGVRALRHLADTFEEHGGNRVALVAFASKARLFFPLTQDYDHLRHTLTQIEADDYQRLADPEPAFGTRIGAALKLAVASIDPARVNRPIIVLLSDGDDPAGDDEWLHGAIEAKAKQIHVHTVGIGNPHQDQTIPVGNEILQFAGQPVLTRLHEKPLEEIARRTAGQYLAARTETFPLGDFVQYLLDADELREEILPDHALPILQLQYAWFLLPAVLLFMLTMLLNEGPSPTKSNAPVKSSALRNPRSAAARAKSAAFLVVLFAILGMSAADPPTPESLLRQANEAFGRQDYKAALEFYEGAEALTRDPGLVSFNKAAAHYRLGQYKDAIECYRRCLEDDRASKERKARAYFDMGNALVQYADDNPRSLAEAVAAYRLCLHQAELPMELRAKARHNLELAQMLWLKLNPKDVPESSAPKKNPFEEETPQASDFTYQPVDPTKKFETQQSDDVPANQKSKNLRSQGMATNLSDSDKLDPLSHDAALSMLANETRRIANARRQQHNPGGPAMLATKDW